MIRPFSRTCNAWYSVAICTFSSRGRLLVFLSVVSLIGAGCWNPFKKNTDLEPAEFTSPTTTASATAKKNTPPTEAEVRADLLSAMQNFYASKSFRSNVTLKNIRGNVLKRRWIFKNLNASVVTSCFVPGTNVDMVFAEDELFLRFNNEPWANISKIPSAQTIATSMKDSLTGQASLDNLGVDQNLPVKRTADRSRKCDLYRTSLTDKDGKAYEVEICVADGYPKILEIKSASNPLKIEYFDYNAVFLIEKPTK
jgi:hypothetical protein